MMKFFAATALLLAGLIALESSSHAIQPPAPVPLATNTPIQLHPAIKTQRAHYTVRHIDATVLASVVSKHFKGEAEVLAVPAASGNTLLISGSPESIGEIIKLLEQLDRKPRAVEVEIMIVEVISKKGADGKEVDVAGLDPIAKLETLTKAGQTGAIQRITLTAVEGQPITSTTGGSKPIVSGTVVGGGGGLGGEGGGFGAPKGGGPGGAPGRMMQRSITYHETGTTVKLTARIGTEDVVSLDLNVQDSKIRTPEAGDELAAAAFDNNTLTTKLSISPGKSVAAQAVRTEGKAGGTMSLVIVKAHIVAEQGMGRSK